MKRFISGLLFLCTTGLFAQLDYKYDNVLYPVIYPDDLYQFLQDHPGTVLIDVRTPGEYSDTSQYGSLNIGHLKGAVNIPVDSIVKNPKCIEQYAGHPVVLYCSHSQRSRRGSKALKQAGLKDIYNLNGGMSYLNQASGNAFPHKPELIVHNVRYTPVSSEDILWVLSQEDLVILDIRSKKEFEGTDSVEENNIGRLKNAINIPAADIEKRIAELEKYKDRKLLIYDVDGSESHEIAQLLTDKGFKKIYKLTNGLQAIIGKETSTLAMRNKIMTNVSSYVLLNAKEAADLVRENSSLIILDLRPAEEYNNKSEKSWKNQGSIKNSVNLSPEALMKSSSALIPDKSAAVLLYGPGGGKCGKWLTAHGYNKVYCLNGGLWGIISNSANIKGLKGDREILQNHEGLY